MILFNKEGVVKADAMVVTAAAGDGVFLRGAQAGNGFAGVQKFDVGVSNQVGVFSTGGGGTRKQLQEVQCAALTGQQASGFSLQLEQHAIWLNVVSVFNVPGNCD